MHINTHVFMTMLMTFTTYQCSSVNYKLTAVYYGNEGWSMSQIQYLSYWSTKRPTVILLFTDWCNSSMNNLFNIQLNNIWNNHSIPVITWELLLCSGISQPGIIKAVTNGVYDAYIHEYGDRLKTWLAGSDGIFGNNDDRRAYLRLGKKYNHHKNTSQSIYIIGFSWLSFNS
jgi:hypothetical protein